MTVTVQELLDKVGIDDIFPGQKIVKPYKNSGEFKSHCMVFDWKNPQKLRIEVKAGLTGKDLPPSELRKYPVSLQTPTYFEFEIEKKEPVNKNKHKTTIGQKSET